MQNTNTWNVFSSPEPKEGGPNKLITVSQIIGATNKFYAEVLSTLSDGQYLLIIFKIRTNENLIRSISTLQRVNKFIQDDLIAVFIEHWELKEENYKHFKIEEIILNYKIISKEESKENTAIINKPLKNRVNYNNFLKIGTYNFPVTMDLFEWGGVDFILNDKEAIVFKKHSHSVYHIRFIENTHKMVVEYRKSNRVIVSFTDELLDVNNLGTFRLLKIKYFILRMVGYFIKK
uniref:DNA polymerase n=1 Tax=Dichomitus squalens TaxID=114155 RepID=UPI0030039094|nr:DNA polymerase [Dichomitus squalens]